MPTIKSDKSDKSDRQALMEARRGKPLGEILRETLEARRGSRNIVTHVAHDLEIAVPTLYLWCREYRISIADYR